MPSSHKPRQRRSSEMPRLPSPHVDSKPARRRKSKNKHGQKKRFSGLSFLSGGNEASVTLLPCQYLGSVDGHVIARRQQGEAGYAAGLPIEKELLPAISRELFRRKSEEMETACAVVVPKDAENTPDRLAVVEVRSGTTVLELSAVSNTLLTSKVRPYRRLLTVTCGNGYHVLRFTQSAYIQFILRLLQPPFMSMLQCSSPSGSSDNEDANQTFAHSKYSDALSALDELDSFLGGMETFGRRKSEEIIAARTASKTNEGSGPAPARPPAPARFNVPGPPRPPPPPMRSPRTTLKNPPPRPPVPSKCSLVKTDDQPEDKAESASGQLVPDIQLCHLLADIDQLVRLPSDFNEPLCFRTIDGYRRLCVA